MSTAPRTPGSLIQPFFIAIAMLILSGAVALASSMGVMENQLILRIIGVSLGIILIATANYFPKRIYPTCSPKFTRRIAWLFAIAGLLYILVWITGDTQRTALLPALMFAPACIISMLLYRYAHTPQTPCIPMETQS